MFVPRLSVLAASEGSAASNGWSAAVVLAVSASASHLNCSDKTVQLSLKLPPNSGMILLSLYSSSILDIRQLILGTCTLLSSNKLEMQEMLRVNGVTVSEPLIDPKTK